MERRAVDDERGADDHERRSAGGTSDGLLDREASDSLHRHGHGADHAVEFVERARARNHVPLVIPDMMDDEVDAEAFHPSGAFDAII